MTYGIKNKPIQNESYLDAIKYIDSDDNKSLQKVIISEIKKENLNKQINKRGDTLVIYAAKKNNDSSLRLLEKLGANLNVRNIAFVTPLHIAAKNGNKKIIQFLLSKKVEINPKDIEGFTPLMRAIILRNFEISKILKNSGASFDIKNKYGHNAIDLIESINEQNEKVKFQELLKWSKKMFA